MGKINQNHQAQGNFKMKKKINVVISINNLEKKRHLIKTIGKAFDVPTHRQKGKLGES